MTRDKDAAAAAASSTATAGTSSTATPPTLLPLPVLFVVLFAGTFGGFHLGLDNAEAAILPFLPNFYLTNFMLTLLGMVVVDVVCRFFFSLEANASWYFIHALVNAGIVVMCVEDLVSVLGDPMHCHEGFPRGKARDSMSPIMALHLYHVLALPCTTEDYIHHGVSVLGVGGLGCTFSWGKILNAVNFFICGLPGGVDYGLLFLTKIHVIHRITEKRINLWLNMLIRWPGIVVTLYIATIARLHQTGPGISWIPLLLVVVGHGGNAAFYAQKVAGNTHVTMYKLQSHHRSKHHNE
eukprot:m.490059 g.490059  ORF g.490059 m.490059 type:complete len:295 (+) comp27394_c0_seq1:105-989(+)